MQQKPPRPTGVTIIAILSILFGLGGLALGGLLLAASAIINTIDITTTYPQLAMYNLTSATIATIIGIIGAVFLIIGILDLVVGIGFLGGRGWARIIGMIVAVLNILSGIGEIFVSPVAGAVWLVIWIGLLYYMTRPQVKAFFGKAAWGPSTTGSSMMSASTMGTSTSTSSPPTMGTSIKCPACGAMAPAGSTKCPNCGAML